MLTVCLIDQDHLGDKIYVECEQQFEAKRIANKFYWFTKFDILSVYDHEQNAGVKIEPYLVPTNIYANARPRRTKARY